MTVTTKLLATNDRIAFPENYTMSQLGLNPSLTYIIRLELNGRWFPCLVYTPSAKEIEAEQYFGDSLPLAFFRVHDETSSTSEGVIERIIRHNKLIFMRRFGIGDLKKVSPKALDELLDPSREENVSWLHFAGIRCSTEGEMFRQRYMQWEKLDMDKEQDLPKLPIIPSTPHDPVTSFLISGDPLQIIEGLTRRLDLPNNQYFTVIPAFEKGKVETHLEERTKGTDAELCIGVVSIYMCATGDIFTCPHYYTVVYSRCSEFLHEDELVRVNYERHSGPIWVTPTSGERELNTQGVETDQIYQDRADGGYYDRKEGKYHINMQNLLDVFFLPSSRNELGAYELFYVTKGKEGTECITRGMHFPSHTDNSPGYQRSQHRELSEIFKRIDVELVRRLNL